MYNKYVTRVSAGSQQRGSFKYDGYDYFSASLRVSCTCCAVTGAA
ncbi:Uncharacterised protein [Serratia liquefaciens]|nr:Uncharacterised protein [Serratia liquefaciens]CAI1949850.1 Uncharacterised protein [Serratia liquefaciens]